MKKLLSFALVVLLSAALCCVSAAAEYSLEDVLTVMKALSQDSVSADVAAYDQNSDGALRLNDVLRLIQYCKKTLSILRLYALTPRRPRMCA